MKQKKKYSTLHKISIAIEGISATIFLYLVNFLQTSAKYRTIYKQMSKEIIYIFLGGGTGSVLRYCIQLLMHERIMPYSFPWATFTVNLLGSFLIGLFYALSERLNLSIEIRLLLTTGLCGGFTTFSTFSNDGMNLLKGEFYGTFILYTLLSIAIGLVAVMAGGYIGKQY